MTPTTPGLYRVSDHPDRPLSDDLIARWVDKPSPHWRTVGGRIDGDNRIPDGNIVAWQGPLVPQVDAEAMQSELEALRQHYDIVESTYPEATDAADRILEHFNDRGELLGYGKWRIAEIYKCCKIIADRRVGAKLDAIGWTMPQGLVDWMHAKDGTTTDTQPAVRCFVGDDYLWAYDGHPDGPMTFGLHIPWVERVKGIALADLQKPNSEIKPITYADALARLSDRPEQAAKLRAMGE